MRLKYTKLLTMCVVATNLCLVYFTVRYFTDDPNSRSYRFAGGGVGTADEASAARTAAKGPHDRVQSTNKHIKKMITIVFRDFFFFDTDLQASIESILNLIPSIQIVIVYDDEPYPALDFVANLTTRPNVHFVSSAFDVFRTGRTVSPLSLIRSRYTLLVPDGMRLGGRSILQKMLKEFERGGNDGALVKLKRGEKKRSTVAELETPVGGIAGQQKPAGAKWSSKLLIVPFGSNNRHADSCCRMRLGFVNWTIEYTADNGVVDCDMYTQKHGIFIESSVLKDMPDPLMTPFPEMLYVQAKVANIQKIVLPATLQDGKRLFTAFHNKKRRKDVRHQQFRDMYKRLRIKKIVRFVSSSSSSLRSASVPEIVAKPGKPERRNANAIEGGANALQAPPPVVGGVKIIDLLPPRRRQLNASSVLAPHVVASVEYYGCERNTRSCVGTVFDSRPFFVQLGRHTPPCCTEKLKAVARHVLDELQNVGIRYWLDNVALQSAIETNALALDAFEVDIGFYVSDLERSESLKKCQTRPLSDAAGYYWMKATDGHYFRVLFSKLNQIGVNLLPFDIEHNRVVPNGFYGWKAKEFSAEFLHPMSNVIFLGKEVMCPNNVREFLAIKDL